MNLPDQIKSWTESIMWMYVMLTQDIYLACRYTDALSALLEQWKKSTKQPMIYRRGRDHTPCVGDRWGRGD